MASPLKAVKNLTVRWTLRLFKPKEYERHLANLRQVISVNLDGGFHMAICKWSTIEKCSNNPQTRISAQNILSDNQKDFILTISNNVPEQESLHVYNFSSLLTMGGQMSLHWWSPTLSKYPRHSECLSMIVCASGEAFITTNAESTQQ